MLIIIIFCLYDSMLLGISCFIINEIEQQLLVPLITKKRERGLIIKRYCLLSLLCVLV